MTSSPNLAAWLDGGRSKEKGSVDCDGNGRAVGGGDGKQARSAQLQIASRCRCRLGLPKEKVRCIEENINISSWLEAYVTEEWYEVITVFKSLWNTQIEWLKQCNLIWMSAEECRCVDADVELASLGGWSYQIWRSTPPDVADAFSGGSPFTRINICILWLYLKVQLGWNGWHRFIEINGMALWKAQGGVTRGISGDKKKFISKSSLNAYLHFTNDTSLHLCKGSPFQLVSTPMWALPK